MAIMWIQLTNVMKSCLVTKRRSVLQSQAAISNVKKTGISDARTLFFFTQLTWD